MGHGFSGWPADSGSSARGDVELRRTIIARIQNWGGGGDLGATSLLASEPEDTPRDARGAPPSPLVLAGPVCPFTELAF
jgi:hypothetical protein